MKPLHLSIIVIAGIVMITGTSLAFADQNPIIITQVELWGPTSFYTDGIKLCGYNETSIGPWALGWIELYNTKNETVTIDNVNLTGKGWEEGHQPITLGPNEYCYIVTQDSFTTRIGVGGSQGNGPPIHENSTITLAYSIQSFAGKVIQKYSTPKLSDDFGDTRTWQLVGGNWVFKEANVKHEFPIKTTLLSPSKQTQSGIGVKDLKCKEGFVVIVKKSDPTNQYLQDFPSCMTPSSASKLVDRGWGVLEQTMPIQNTNSTVTYYVEGSKLDKIVPDLATHGLTLTMETTGDGKITLFLPRSFVDNPQIGDYTLFNVTANGKKIDYDEHLTPTDRRFLILFTNETKNIVIIPQLPSGTTQLPVSFMPCQTRYPQVKTGIAVLYMPMNTIGKICVRYSNPNDTPYSVGITIFKANNMNQNATGITTWNDLGNNSTIPKGNSTVVYWINTGNQSGLYGLGFYCNNWNPFAVGYDNNSNMTAGDFPFLRETVPCPFQPYQLHIDSLTGIGVKHIPYP
jgi:hypothetical protein